MARKIIWLACLLAGLMIQVPMKAQELIKGLDQTQSFAAASDGAVLSFQSHGKTFKAMALWHNGAVVVAVDDAGRRSVVYESGKPRGLQTATPKIGFDGASESRSNRYLLGIHDFTNDGQPELVIAVSDASDGLGVYVLAYDGSAWAPIGEMVTAGKAVGNCRVFRQAITMKGADNILYSWTCHGSSFDFLSSDHNDNPALLY